MKTRTRESLVEEHKKQSSEWLADHVLLRHQEVFESFGIVTIGKPNWSFEHRVDFVVSPMGYLTMAGDHDTVCWGMYRGKTVSGAISWMARSSPLDHYFLEKVSIGMGGHFDLTHFDSEVAAGDAILYRDQARDDGNHEETAAWERILRDLHTGDDDRDSLLEAVAEFDEDYLYSESLGMAPTFRLLWAWSLIRKADELIQKSKKADGAVTSPNSTCMSCSNG